VEVGDLMCSCFAGCCCWNIWQDRERSDEGRVDPVLCYIFRRLQTSGASLWRTRIQSLFRVFPHV